MMILSESLEFYFKEARQFKQDLSEIDQSKDINTYYRQCSGKIYVQKRLKLLEWWENLPEDLTEKILSLPLKVFNFKHWFRLTQLSLEQTLDWYNNIFSLLQERGKLFALDILNIAQPMFSPKPINSLKLGEDVSEEGLSLVQKKFSLDDQQLADIKTQLKATEGKTENLLALLEDLELDPLKLLTPKAQLAWQKGQYEAQLAQKDAQLALALTSLDEAIAETQRSQDLVQEQAGIISRQEKAIQQQSEQIKQLLELSQANNKKPKSKSNFFKNVEKATATKTEVTSNTPQYANVS
ncbi:MAG: hypothetical protein MK111_25420 [Crocosphaera sp.]|uniref:hypothetical protein n=1 Tax=Crocosphaera sp. TaxID=2729996 RepID=UPI00257C612A|nr:hypothetical protein [Crocosphaera sp.]MCH2247928.1 hypothetical protein [Crocosphaera sp.]NQZ64721.1 hypothetical protein [Crocosphaera sp.]